jgi:phosphomannomutase
MQEFMRQVRGKVVIGLVGGSDLDKIEEQMAGTFVVFLLFNK